MPEKTRTLRTPAERAIAALGVEQRRVDNIEAKIARLRAELEPLVADLDAARLRRDYLAQHPDLPREDAETTEEDR